MSSKSVIIIGGGLAGLSAAVALAEVGLRVRLYEKRPHLGGRATSYDLPNGEHVDNCQHVTMGCCTNLADFYRRAGAAEKIRFYDRLYFLDTRGRRSIIKSSPLPPPFHLAPSFTLFPSLTWSDKDGIARAMLAVAKSAGRPADADGITMLEWLHRRKQTRAAIERFWRVVLVSALDEELDRAGAHFGVEVFWKAFLSTRRGFEVGIPAVPLAELYDGCRVAIEQRGGQVASRAAARALELEGERIAAISFDDGSRAAADYFISAVPHDALPNLLPEKILHSGAGFANLGRLRVSPITGVHFWFDRMVMREPFLTLLDRTVQWIFNKSLLMRPAEQSGVKTADAVQYLQLVISASYGLLPRSRQEIIDLCLAELHDAVPATRTAQLVKATVVKEASATFSPEPGADRWRLPQRTAIKNFLLAGDWTATGWPATMEGAVRSGYLAAEAILELEGCPQRLLQPDLPAEGFSRRWEMS